MAGLGSTARTGYVAVARAGRGIATRTGALERLDRAYRTHPRGVRGQLRTLLAIHDVEDLVTLDVPWWTYRAIDVVDAHLRRLGGAARVFEYGSGASSVWLGRRAAEVHTVEHDAGFAAVMTRVVAAADLAGTVDLLTVPPVVSPAPVTPSQRRGEEGRDYTDYVRSIDRVDGAFDLLVVDGRARVACLRHALPRLAPEGLVLFDDSERPRYREGLEASGLELRRLRGWAPSLPYPRESAVLRRRPAQGGTR